MTKSETYTPTGAQALQPVIPMPASVANNINLGWNSATGQVIQPLSQQMQAGAYTAPIGNLGIKTPQQSVFPLLQAISPRNVQTGSVAPGPSALSQITQASQALAHGVPAGAIQQRLAQSQTNYNTGRSRF